MIWRTSTSGPDGGGDGAEASPVSPRLAAKTTREPWARVFIAIHRPCLTGSASLPYAAFEEDLKGSLRLGKLADIVVLSKNILPIPERKIPTSEVLYTIARGRPALEGDGLWGGGGPGSVGRRAVEVTREVRDQVARVVLGAVDEARFPPA